MATDSPQPQRVWKGCLTPAQRSQLEPILSVPHPRTQAISPYKGLLHVQHLFAKALLNIRTQLTSYSFPHMRGPAPPLPPTTSQAGDIAALRNQPRITQVFGDATTALRQGGIASRNMVRRLARPPPSGRNTPRSLPHRPLAIVLQGPPPLSSLSSRREDSSLSSPSSPGAISSLPRKPRRIVISPSPSPSPVTSRLIGSEQRPSSRPSTPPRPSPSLPWWTSALHSPDRWSNPATSPRDRPSPPGHASSPEPLNASQSTRFAPAGPIIFALPDSPPPDPP